jgi:DNA-binding response OmpR family regulator
MSKKILLVEDSIYTAKAIKLILGSEGITVDHVTDGCFVMDALKINNYGLIILDLMLPTVSGKEVFHMLKVDPKAKDIPVIILTARLDIVQWDEELQTCNKYLKKPFDNNELIAEVKKLIK